MPERIQLSRRKGWRKPENTVVVAWPSKWGNPFTVAALGRERAVRFFANWLSTPLDEQGHRLADGSTEYHGVEVARRPTAADIRRELAGKNLACWCPLDHPCHADVLLEVANRADD